MMAEIDETLTKIVDLSSNSSEDQYCYERTTRHIQRAAERPAVREKTTPPSTGCGEAQRLLLRGDRIIGHLQRAVLNVEELSQELRRHPRRSLDRFLTCPLIHTTLITVMKTILKQILDEINEDLQFNLTNVDWDGLKEAVKNEGVNKHSRYNDIKDVVLDLFETIGYDAFGIVEVSDIDQSVFHR
jgi:hypothetical protein